MRVHDIFRLGDHMIHILTLFWPWNRSTTPQPSVALSKINKITFLLLFILSVRDFCWLVHYSVIVGVI